MTDEGKRERSVSCEEVQPEPQGEAEPAEQPRNDRGKDDDRGRDTGGESGKSGGSGTLFVGQLSFEAEESDIRDKFERYGEILSVEIIKDKGTGRSKGFGFIKFADAADAEKVLRTMDGSEIVGRRCKLDRAGQGKPGGRDRDFRDRDGKGRDDGRGRRDDRGGGGFGREKNSEPDKLFIGKLSLETTEDDIHDAFAKCGDITVQIIKDRENGESRGFGFIKFRDADAAEEAMRTMQGAEIGGQECRLERAGQRAGGGGGGGGSGSGKPPAGGAGGGVGGGAGGGAGADPAVSDLEARLNNLRK
mmetsp:Transcript_12647/g.22353  ORF Transcript_12647/g.22353 Transcript_12647/m.22353 type:complete len:304 (+) Transcript_12647:35-946(+)